MTASRKAPTSGPARSTSRDTLGSTFGAARPKMRATSAAVPPWAPTPGARNGPLRPLRSAAASPMVAPTTTPKEPSGRASALRAASSSMTVWATVRPSAVARVLDLRALRVGGQREHEDPGAVACGERRTPARSEPTPRYGLTVIASAASGDGGSR